MRRMHSSRQGRKARFAVVVQGTRCITHHALLVTHTPPCNLFRKCLFSCCHTHFARFLVLFLHINNLRCYVREAVLPAMLQGRNAPPMPMAGHKSHLNSLSIRPEHYRKLESMWSFNDAMMDELITSWIDTYIPETPLEQGDEDEVTGERLSIPCSPFNIPSQRLIRPSDASRLASWLDNFPLQTVQRALHLACPQTSNWGFQLDNQKDVDDAIFRHFFWTVPSASEPPDPQISRHSVVIAFQPPWVLGPHDMRRLADCRSFPPFQNLGHKSLAPLPSKQRIWAKLWDLCVRKRCPWFVISTYSGWCYGAFSRGWTQAFISSVYDFDSQSPTVVEILLFWLISAMGLPGGWKIPEVAEPVVNMASGFSIPQPHDDRYFNSPSESSWDGKSDETGISAGLKRPLSPDVSERGLPYKRYTVTEPRVSMPPDLRRRVFKWVHSVAPPSVEGSRERSPTPTLSESSWSSASSESTIVDGAMDGKYYGDWLTLLPPSD